MYLNGQPLRAARGARSSSRRPVTATRSAPPKRTRWSQELQAIGANAARSQHPLPAEHARTPRRRRDPGVAGRRPRRPLRRLDGHHAAAGRTGAGRRAHHGAGRRAAPLDHRLEPHQRDGRQRPPRRAGAVRRSDVRVAARLRPRADGRGGRVGRAPPAPRRGPAVPRRRRGLRDRLLRLVRGPARQARDAAQADRRAASPR